MDNFAVTKEVMGKLIDFADAQVLPLGQMTSGFVGTLDRQLVSRNVSQRVAHQISTASLYEQYSTHSHYDSAGLA